MVPTLPLATAPVPLPGFQHGAMPTRDTVPVFLPDQASAVEAAHGNGALEFLCRRITDLERRLAALGEMELRLGERMDKGFAGLLRDLEKHRKTAAAEESVPVRTAPVMLPLIPAATAWPPPQVGTPPEPEDNEPGLCRCDAADDGSVILLVDDDMMVRHLTAVMLQKAGCSVDTADCGQAALDAWMDSPGRYALIMLDLAMPGLSGEQTYKRLKEEQCALPVLFYSGYGYQLAELFARYGGRNTDFLQKPFEPAQLMERVRRLLSAAAAQRAA